MLKIFNFMCFLSHSTTASIKILSISSFDWNVFFFEDELFIIETHGFTDVSGAELSQRYPQVPKT